MKRRIELDGALIGPGAVVRLKKAAASSLKDLMARWIVVAFDSELVLVHDKEDLDDTRTFSIGDLERVSSGIVVDKIAAVASPCANDGDEDEDEPELYWGVDGFLHFADDFEDLDSPDECTPPDPSQWD